MCSAHTHSHGEHCSHGHHDHSQSPGAGHHHHDHHNPGEPPHTGSYAERNKEYFDTKAAVYDDLPGTQALLQSLSAAMRKVYNFDENTTTLLDFACGTGLLSRNLAAHTKSIVGADISQGMVDQYNLRVSNQGIAPEEMKAIRVELKGQEGELDGAKFDVVACSMAYHHFESIESITKILTFFLKPGGVLLVGDILNSGGDFVFHKDEKAHHYVPHKSGFTSDEMKKVFEDAGLKEFVFEQVTVMKKDGQDIPIFLARGTK
ncbi:hypothetical protein JAAARDRAFT_33321 [Jaapia argillacea MUCL 33604]|uniref:Methyltransferase domain-containing protein n=1 Tax=Jaapia argillacea MUCL 33604 TaxID=933084 RepID=A0A067PYF3_9AGAM|nr:hypothetical protein JAAARDRAFT_33321 [Jaapia argillacea MUCL 33604]